MGDDEDEDKLDKMPPITIPQRDKTSIGITMLKSDKAVESIGLFARPDGKLEAHIKQL